GDVGNACKERVNAGHAYGELGLYERSERLLLYAHEEAARRRFDAVVAYAKVHLANVRRRLGHVAEARAYAEDAAHTFRTLGNRRMETAAAITLAAALRTEGSLEQAEVAARSALDNSAAPPDECRALAAFSEVGLARGRADEALTSARRSI